MFRSGLAALARRGRDTVRDATARVAFPSTYQIEACDQIEQRTPRYAGASIDSLQPQSSATSGLCERGVAVNASRYRLASGGLCSPSTPQLRSGDSIVQRCSTTMSGIINPSSRKFSSATRDGSPLVREFFSATDDSPLVDLASVLSCGGGEQLRRGVEPPSDEEEDIYYTQAKKKVRELPNKVWMIVWTKLNEAGYATNADPKGLQRDLSGDRMTRGLLFNYIECPIGKEWNDFSADEKKTFGNIFKNKFKELIRPESAVHDVANRLRSLAAGNENHKDYSWQINKICKDRCDDFLIKPRPGLWDAIANCFSRKDRLLKSAEQLATEIYNDELLMKIVSVSHEGGGKTVSGAVHKAKMDEKDEELRLIKAEMEGKNAKIASMVRHKDLLKAKDFK